MRSLIGTRRVYAPLLVGVALIVAMFLVAESGHSRLRDATVVIAESQQRQAQLSRYLQLLLEAETAQRGFLLTEDTRYLRQFDPAVQQLDPLLDQIIGSFEQSSLPAEVAKAEQLRKLSGVKLGEMLGSLRLYGESDLQAALALINTDIGEKSMADIRGIVTELAEFEDERVRLATESWREDLRSSRLLLAAATLLSLILMVMVGVQIARDIGRRERDRAELGERNRELDRVVKQRTATLFNLSSNLQQLTEREKAALARELHDELGGLLVATKIDVSWLRRQCDDGTPGSALRWERVLRCLDEGLDLKRRVIENLRPTLLDNVGLVAALRWLVDETIRRAGIACTEEYAEPLPELPPDTRIAVFRVVQECLMNILKHAQAKSVHLLVSTDGQGLAVTVRDDGVGLDEERIEVPQAHGLLGMRHRVEALGGQLRIQSLGAGRGTQISFALPGENARRSGGNESLVAMLLAGFLILAGCGDAPKSAAHVAASPPPPPAASAASQTTSYEVAIAIAAANRNRDLKQCDAGPVPERKDCEARVGAEWEATKGSLEDLRGNQS
ncbi:MAG: CHASE3 domain-containing protein [Steroidobacteraceae bacterium]